MSNPERIHLDADSEVWIGGRTRAIDLTARRFDRWCVIARAPNPGKAARWRCRCVCGTERVVAGVELRRGRSRSCGCLGVDLTRGRASNHHMSETPTWRSWRAMHARCYDRESFGFANYGGRGVRVCARWHTFDAFLVDMGQRPMGTTIDRRDTSGDYTPGNCRWATPVQQANNRRDNVRLTIGNATRTLAEWAREWGRSEALIRHRWRRGWSLAELPMAPLRRGQMRQRAT